MNNMRHMRFSLQGSANIPDDRNKDNNIDNNLIIKNNKKEN